MSSTMILTEIISCKLFFMFHNANTQLAAGVSASSIECHVASTIEEL